MIHSGGWAGICGIMGHLFERLLKTNGIYFKVMAYYKTDTCAVDENASLHIS